MIPVLTTRNFYSVLVTEEVTYCSFVMWLDGTLYIGLVIHMCLCPFNAIVRYPPINSCAMLYLVYVKCKGRTYRACR